MSATGKSATVGDEHTHTFRVIPPQATIDLGEGDLAKQPNSCNLCHYHAKHSPKVLQARLNNARKELEIMK